MALGKWNILQSILSRTSNSDHCYSMHVWHFEAAAFHFLHQDSSSEPRVERRPYCILVSPEGLKPMYI